jgi:hypothetical protein
MSLIAGLGLGVVAGWLSKDWIASRRLSRLESFYLDEIAGFRKTERDLLDRIMSGGNYGIYEALRNGGKAMKDKPVNDDYDRAEQEKDDYGDMQFGTGPYGG